MLKKWIDEIHSQRDLYKSECWKYHLSGNVIEISILPAYLKKKRLYRCSVITVGQVLQALSKKIEEQNLNFHIQSFPNIENHAIVATIRTDEKQNPLNDSATIEKKIIKSQDIFAALYNFIKKYQFEIKQVKEPTEFELSNLISFENYKSWFAVSSTHNNPFTWLNIGYLKEVLREVALNENTDYLMIYDLCTYSNKQASDHQISEHEHLQTLIGIQPSNITTG